MSLPVVFRRAAQCEFLEAAEWYEYRRRGRGAKFTAAVRDVLTRIAEQPEFFAPVFEDVREALVSKYPYCVYYRIDGERIRIASVFGMSGLAAASAFAAVLGFVFGGFDDVAGGRLGGVSGVFLGGGELRLQLDNSGLELFKLLFQSGASCARLRPCSGHNATRYSIAENGTRQTEGRERLPISKPAPLPFVNASDLER